MHIYVASSWRNAHQPKVVEILRRGHTVYDFRNPGPGDNGFSWAQIDPNWQKWTPAEYRNALKHPIARAGFRNDMSALNDCDACVLVLPSGRSASWEFGYAMGQGKDACVFMPDPCEPELMYSEAAIATTWDELKQLFNCKDP